MEITRLDHLWCAIAEGGAGGDEVGWLRFYEGFAAQRLIVPVEANPGNEASARPVTLALETGEVALAFDTEARFTAFIVAPTEFISLTGAELARAMAPLDAGVALNPGVAPGETVLDARALAWIATHSGAEVAVAEMPGGARILPPADPEAALLEALATRLAEMGGHVDEAWLAGVDAPNGATAYLCVLCPSGEAAAIAAEIAAELTRIGQSRTARPFSVAVAPPDGPLLDAARRLGIGLVTAQG